jgi:hypothetical protein
LQWQLVEGWLGFWVFLVVSKGKPMFQDKLAQGGEADSPLIHCGSTERIPGREPLRHLLIGSPRAVGLTIHQLHRLRYCEAGQWSHQLKVPGHDLVVTPHKGEVLSILVRYLLLE